LSFAGRKFKGLRGWAGKPTHPPLTDFPVAAYVFAALFDLVSVGDVTRSSDSLHEAATFVLVAGFVVSLGAIATGLADWLSIGKGTQVWRTANWHVAVMGVTTAVVIADIALRLAGGPYDQTPIHLAVLSTLAGGLVAFGAVYGGSLVYEYQFNIESLEGSTVWDQTDIDQTVSGKQSSTRREET